MSKIGSHDPFGFLKHKLWPTERSRVKLAVWLMSTKNQKSPWFPRVQAACHIAWKDLDKGYNFVLDLISIGGLHTKLWAPKVAGVPIWGISGLQLESLGTKWHLGASPVARHKEYYKGEGGGFSPSLGRGESCEYVFAHGFSMHQKCSNSALTNLLFGLCRSVWIIDSLVICPSPHAGAPTHPSTPKMLWAREHAQLLILSLFSHLDSQLSLPRSLEVCQGRYKKN
jgi:hypothetical protein